MNRHRQRLKYLLSDFVTAAIVWCLMNILRYYEVARYDGFHSLGQFLTFHQVIIMQLFIPLFWLALYYRPLTEYSVCIRRGFFSKKKIGRAHV